MKSTTYTLFLATTITVCLLNSATRTQEQATCEDLNALISGDHYRVAGHLFSASSYLDDHLPVEARLPGGEGWCSTVLGFGIQEPWLEVYFGVDVIAYIISIFGNVTEYRVQFTTSTDGELRFLMDPATTEPKLFTAAGKSENIVNTTLGTALVAERIRIAPTTWTSNPLCLQLEVYGCPLNTGCANESNLYSSPDLLSPDNVLYSDGQAIPGLLTADDFTCFPGNDPLPTITLNFSQPVLITRAGTLHLITLIHGSQVEVTYVDAYTIATTSDGENFTTYSDPSGEAEILTDKVNTFWEPVQAEQFLKLIVARAVKAIGQVCWCLELYGCPAPEPVQSSGFQLASISITITSQVPSISPLSFPSPTSSVAAPPSDHFKDTDVILQRDFLVLEIVLPVALATIVIVVFVNLAGVAYCIRLNRARKYKLKLLSPAPVHYRLPKGNSNKNHDIDNTIKVLHNALYSSQESISESQEENHCGVNVPNFSYESMQFTAGRNSAKGAMGSRPTDQMEQDEMADMSGVNPPQGYEIPISPGAPSALHAPSTSISTDPGVTSTAAHHAYESIMLGGKGITEQPPLKAGVPREAPLKAGVPREAPLKAGVPREPPLKVGVPREAPLKAGVPQLLLTISQDDSEYELMESTKPRSESYMSTSAEAGISAAVRDSTAIDPQLQYANTPSPVLVQEGDFSLSVASAC